MAKLDPPSDAFDDDADHWGLVDLERDDESHDVEVPPPWPFLILALVLVLSVLLMVWSGVFSYG